MKGIFLLGSLVFSIIYFMFNIQYLLQQINNIKLIKPKYNQAMKNYGEYSVISQKIGSGAFGQIFLGANRRNEKVALKIQKSTSKNPQLYYEYKILMILDTDGRAHERGLLKVYDYFTQGDENVMVMKVLGDSLETLFKKSNKIFDPKSILMIGLQILERIEYVHSQGFIHRDIKPDNFLIGKDAQSNTIYMIDFGLAKKFRTKDGQHIPYKDNKNLTGTARYASINTHLGIEQGRRDDVQGLIYMLIYFFKGQLPWQNMDAKNKKEKYEKILEKKISTNPEQLCSGLPTQIIRILKYIRNVYFDQQPNYNYIRQQLEQAMAENKYINDKVFCWNMV